MARLGGLSSEAFSPPAGLGSILRDQKVLPGVRSSRSNVVFGMVRPPITQSVSVSSSLKDSFLIDVGTAEESDDLKEEDIWGMDDTIESAGSMTDFEKHRMSAADELSLGISPKGMANSVMEELGFGIGSARNDYADNAKPAKQLEKAYGAADAFVSSGAIGSSLLARTPERSSRARIPRRPSASRMIPLSAGGGKDPSRRHAEGQSAPVEVPKWSKMGHNDKVGLFDDDDHMGAKDDDDDRLPPHELLARENARSQCTTFSVCEGLGRTLKGRDLSRVRNAVWSQMGFAD
ncbi:hypothetical protein GOP47_0002787 [Adiantum capillus-veneris]|uniref:Senescence regulator n=1 Tax=Adiantum capillus-veneris TaxID=13818 RepID=A0A9D4VBJ3_ADICA|nr:hypothetical protein GOP47_0002787 [Adiantum capillus-veneris]